MMVVGKLMNGKLVEIRRVAESVEFSTERGWICIVGDFEKRINWQQDIRWVPASTPFMWIRDFRFA